MAYHITDICVSCGTCLGPCPVNAISLSDTQYEIDPDLCIECGECERNCPVGAPEPA